MLQWWCCWYPMCLPCILYKVIIAIMIKILPEKLHSCQVYALLDQTTISKTRFGLFHGPAVPCHLMSDWKNRCRFVCHCGSHVDGNECNEILVLINGEAMSPSSRICGAWVETLTSLEKYIGWYLGQRTNPLRAKFFRGNTYIYILFHSSTLIWHRKLKSFLTLDLRILHKQYHGCWCPGDARSQGISNHDIDQVKPRNSVSVR